MPSQTQIDRQLELEEAMRDNGFTRFEKEIEGSIKTGRYGQLGLEGVYLRNHCLPTEAARKRGFTGDLTFRDYVENVMNNLRPGRQSTSWEYIRNANIPPEDVVFIVLPLAFQYCYEQKTRNQFVAACALRLEDEINHRKFQDEYTSDYRSIMSNIKTIHPKDHRYIYRKNAALIGMEWVELDKRTGFGIGVALLAGIFAHCGDAVVQYKVQKKRKTEMRLTFGEAFASQRERINYNLGMRSPVFSPMIVPPAPFTTPWDGGYIGALQGKCRAVHSKLPKYQIGLAQQWNPESIHIQALNKIMRTGYI